MSTIKRDPKATVIIGPELFIQAAWTHVHEFLASKDYVPDVMLLGRYRDEELLFVFPSGQDQGAFASACVQQAAEFGADIAMMICESSYSDGSNSTAIATVTWCERGKPQRIEYAPLLRHEGMQTQIGAAVSHPTPAENRYLTGLFREGLH